MKRKLFIPAITLCLLSVHSLIAAELHSALAPAHRHSWWTTRNDAVNERVKQGSVDLLMIGDSITHGWEGGGKKYWDLYYSHRNAVNMGFSGDRTQHVLWRLDHGHLEGISPKLAVIMIGTNNSNGNDNTAEEIADGIIAICDRLNAKCPKTKILILAIFPRGERPSAQREKNVRASLLASKIADGKMIHYLDINDKFLDDNQILSKEIMPDLLHPNEYGYKIWAEAIEPKVAELLGQEPFKPIFNNKDLTGWQATGNAEWYVENGCFVGKQGKDFAPGDLFTTDSYKDFEVTAVYRAEWPCNSGIWFRYQSPNKAYQADILEWKNPVCWSGTLYCPGKMFLAMNENKDLVDRDGWNTMRIRAQGKNLGIWLNGSQVANVRDDTTESGRIGFQVHPGNEFGKMKIIVKEILIRPIKSTGSKRVSLFDGKTLENWDILNCQAKVDQGEILLLEGNGLLQSKKKYRNFILEFDWKALAKDKWDSGVYFRYNSVPQGRPWPPRYQVNLRYGQEGNVGALKDARSQGLTKDGQWNKFKLTVTGQDASLDINGQKAWKATGLSEPEGFIALQAEVPMGGRHRFRNIYITELN